jgi:hypothetical protein
MATGIEIERQRAQRYRAEAEQCRADAAKTIDLMIRPASAAGYCPSAARRVSPSLMHHLFSDRELKVSNALPAR